MRKIGRYISIVRAWAKRPWQAVRYYATGLNDRLFEHHVFLNAGGLAFSLFVCILPLILIVFSGLGVILERPQIVQEINSFIDSVIPYQEYAEFIKDLVSSRIREFTLYKNVAGLIGLVGILFAASGLFSSMRTILNSVFKARDTGTILRGKAKDILLVFVVLVFFLLALAVLPAIDVAIRFAQDVAGPNLMDLEVLQKSVVKVISFAAIFLAYAALYFAVPQKRLPRRTVIVSALAAAVLWEIAKQLFGLYIQHGASIKRVYGTYALLVVVAFWIYYTSIVFIIGAEIGQLASERKAKETEGLGAA
ncbi:YihY/virulence factor BrkB family protein [bacterium]|nr:YihY/virulence factor BrkB family protein [bacterium]MCB2201943.1 YihY/virulence factor BrkB family protein [bacterium]